MSLVASSLMNSGTCDSSSPRAGDNELCSQLSPKESGFLSCDDVENGLVFTLHGPNDPGVLTPFFTIMENPEYQVCLRDIAQYVIEDSVCISILIEHGTESSIAFIRDLVTLSRQKKLDLDFSFSGTLGNRELPVPQMMLAINVACCKSSLPPSLLHDMFSYLGEAQCQILEIVHHRDDRIVVNHECSRIMMRVRCPQKIRISQLYPELHKICWAYLAEVTVREWEGIERPNSKSLVLFGLSDCLCPYNVLDKVLEEAGVDPSSIKCNELTDPNASKVKALKGKDASCMSRVCQNLEFTPGAYLVCKSLKDLGFKLAVITNTGCKMIVQKAKQELGLDYGISRDLEVGEGNVFTGDFAGDHKDEAFNKVDYLQLMAEKEGIHPRNVMIVGNFTTRLSADSVRYVLDTYGPMVRFHFREMPSGSLETILYLLGFSAFDVKELRDKIQNCKLPNGRFQSPVREFGEPPPENTPSSACPECVNYNEKTVGSYYPPDYRRFLIRIRSERNDVRAFAALLRPLLPYCRDQKCFVQRIQQVSLASQNALLGIELVLSGSDPLAPLKDLLLESHRLGLAVQWDEKQGEQAEMPRNQQYIMTMVERPQLALTTLVSVFKVIKDLSVDCIRLERLSDDERFSALQITALVSSDVVNTLRATLLRISKDSCVDIAFQRDGIERWARRLVVFDMDSTLIQEEVIDETAKVIGKEAEVKEITERAMRGELDFHESLQERVALLAEYPAADLWKCVNSALTYTTGASQLCGTLRHLGYKMAVISGGFLPVAREVQKTLGLHYAFANTLEVRQDNGLLTGQTIGPVVTPQRKRALLAMIAQVEGCDMSQTIAIGDGSNDIPMLTSAGLGVAFCAKPKVQAAAEVRVNNKDLNTVLYLIGLSENAQRRLLERHASAESSNTWDCQMERRCLSMSLMA